MLYAFKSPDGEIHITTSGVGYEDWENMGSTDEVLEGPVGFRNGKIASLSYIEKRRAEYPPIVDQLDVLYHGGIDAWRSVIQAVKDKYPKP